MKRVIVAAMLLAASQVWGDFSWVTTGGGGSKIAVTINGTSYKGSYTAETTYAQNDVALYSDGMNYVSIAAGNVGHIPSSSPSWWQPVAARGLPGVNGNDGTAATVAVGTVTTGAAGTSASVSNAGNSNAAVLNFTIPRGDKGDKGDKGDTGVGTQGPKGDKGDPGKGVLASSTPPASPADGDVYVDTTVTIAPVAFSGSYNDLTDKPTSLGGGTWGSITGTLSTQTDLWDKFQLYMLKSDHDTYAAAVQAKFDNMSTQFHALRTAVANSGIDTTPPALTRVTPASASTTSTTDSYTIKYTATDSSGMDSTHPLQYQIGGGGLTDMTSGADTVLTGFTPNAPTTVHVVAKNASGIASTDDTTFTYSTPVAHSDSFTGADGTALATHDSNWTSIDGSYVVGNLALSGGKVGTTTTYGLGGAFYSASTADSSQITVVALANTGQAVSKYAAVRQNTGALGYSARLSLTSGVWTSAGIYKNGSSVQSCTGLNFAASSDHTLKVTASGTSPATVTVFVDGTQVCQKVDSTSPLAAGHPGFYVTGNGTLANNLIDDWRDD